MPPKSSAKPEKNKSLESWIWDAACSIRGAKDAPKYKDYILPLIEAEAKKTDRALRKILKQLGASK